MTIQAPTPPSDTVTNAALEPLKAAGFDVAAIDAALTALLADPTGRGALVEHLADFAVLATEPSMPDAQRGRAVRRHFDR